MLIIKCAITVKKNSHSYYYNVTYGYACPFYLEYLDSLIITHEVHVYPTLLLHIVNLVTYFLFCF